MFIQRGQNSNTTPISSKPLSRSNLNHLPVKHRPKQLENKTRLFFNRRHAAGLLNKRRLSLQAGASSFLCSLPKALPGTQLQTTDSILTDRRAFTLPLTPDYSPAALLRCSLAARDTELTASHRDRPKTPQRTGFALCWRDWAQHGHRDGDKPALSSPKELEK